MRRRLGIGVTGSFGSGCSSVSGVLEKHYALKLYSLSDTLKSEWSRLHPNETFTKEKLQDLGNELRRDHGLEYLAKETHKKIISEKNGSKDIVFDSIRNPTEIDFLRTKFHNFYVIAVDCAETDRWDRLKEKEYISKGLKYDDFRREDARDKNEEGIIYGQQVALCVDQADYLLRNDTDPMVTSPSAFRRIIKGKLEDPMNLFRGNTRIPRKQETYMSFAFTASLMSECIKRQDFIQLYNRYYSCALILTAEKTAEQFKNMAEQPFFVHFKAFREAYRDLENVLFANLSFDIGLFTENNLSPLDTQPRFTRPLIEKLFDYGILNPLEFFKELRNKRLEQLLKEKVTPENTPIIKEIAVDSVNGMEITEEVLKKISKESYAKDKVAIFYDKVEDDFEKKYKILLDNIKGLLSDAPLPKGFVDLEKAAAFTKESSTLKDLLDNLDKLKKLKADKVITQNEFRSWKKRLLDNTLILKGKPDLSESFEDIKKYGSPCEETRDEQEENSK